MRPIARILVALLVSVTLLATVRYRGYASEWTGSLKSAASGYRLTGSVSNFAETSVKSVLDALRESQGRTSSFVEESEEEAEEEVEPKDGAVSGTDNSPANNTAKVLPDRMIVVGKMKDEDTSWLSRELSDWQNTVYAVDDAQAMIHTLKNKGKEANVYLTYLIEHYNDLPSTIVFLHSHEKGYPMAWHTDADDYSNVNSLRTLRIEHVQKSGYVNLRCNGNPGCPEEILPFREPRDEARTAEIHFAEVWRQLFDERSAEGEVPQVVATPCCAQFAVSRDQVLKRPKEQYQHFHRVLMESTLDDEVIGRVYEYLWHIMFGQPAVHCPSTEKCYQDVYGRQFFRA